MGKESKKSPEYFAAVSAAEKEAELIIDQESPLMKGQEGYCHILWEKQKQILKEKYHIDWKTPAERNRAIYD